MTTTELESFRTGALPWQQTVLCAEHLDTCDTCKKLYDQVSLSLRTFRPLIFNFSPAAHLKEFHLSEYETLAPYVDGELDEEVAEMVELHLLSCQPCREDVRFFKEYRLKEERLEQELEVRYAPTSILYRVWNRLGWREPLRLRPLHAASLLLLCLAIALTVILLRPSSSDTQVEVVPAGADAGTTSTPTTNPSSQMASTPQRGNVVSPTSAVAQHTPTEKTNVDADKPLLIALNDGSHRYGLDQQRKLVGLDGLPAGLRREITVVLRKGRVDIHAPDEVERVSVSERGLADEAKMTLLGPAGTVVSQDRPTLRWKPLPEATGYVVTIADSAFKLVVKSQELQTTQWQVSTPLNRDEVYRWQVIALKDGQEIENASDAVAKFKVISEAKARELERAKRMYSSHLTLGLLYAREGMVDDAAREFQSLVKENPRSRLARKLLRSVQSRE